MQDVASSTVEKIKRRIHRKGPGAVVVSRDFLDLGSRATVDQTLSRLVRQGYLQRLSPGLFYYPRIHPRLGVLSPSPDAVAQAQARKTNRRLQITEALAANILGFSTQVPARLVYLTDGRGKRLKVGNQIIELRHASPKTMAGSGKISGIVIQALRSLGPDHIDNSVIDKARRSLSAQDKATLKRDARHAVAWVQPFIEKIVR